MEMSIEAGASDFEADEEFYKITTEVEDFGTIRDILAEKLGDAESADLTYIPNNTQEITDLDTAQKVQKLVDILEEDDDIQDVIINMVISDDIANQL